MLTFKYTFCKDLTVEWVECPILVLCNEVAEDAAEDATGGGGAEGGWRSAKMVGVAWRVVNEGSRVGDPSNDCLTAVLTGEMGLESGK